MKNILILLIVLNATACTFSGFKPPRNTDYWTHRGEFPNGMTSNEYFNLLHKDMRECGIDPFDGYHNGIKRGLCMEAKGWRWTGGPVCEDTVYSSTEERNGSLCRAWRQEHGK